MKGYFSIWAFFGLTLWIDIATHLLLPRKESRINPFNPFRNITVIIPVHKENRISVYNTVSSFYNESYPIKNIIVCGDSESGDAIKATNILKNKYKNLKFIMCPYKSKAKKINFLINKKSNQIQDYVYIRDCLVEGKFDCIEKMVSCFSDVNIGAVTSYGRVSIPKNFLSRSYFYGKAWINEIGRFRKNAQEKRNAVFVVCGASTMYKKDVLKKIPFPTGSKTEDTFHTWLLQKNGYIVRVADDAEVSAPEVDGPGLQGIKNQIKQSYRWSSGTIQCLYREGRGIFKNKRLTYSTIAPGFIEAVMYTIGLILLPLLFFISPNYALGFLIGDTVFSLLGTLIILPKKFGKTLYHYPQILFFKYLNALIFLFALISVTSQALINKTSTWTNEWNPPNS